MNNQVLFQTVVTATAAISVGIFGPQLLDKINENKSKTYKIVNGVGYCTAVFAAGYLVGVLLDTNAKQYEIISKL